jgi:hypothetical protein
LPGSGRFGDGQTGETGDGGNRRAWLVRLRLRLRDLGLRSGSASLLGRFRGCGCGGSLGLDVGELERKLRHVRELEPFGHAFAPDERSAMDGAAFELGYHFGRREFAVLTVRIIDCPEGFGRRWRGWCGRLDG